MEEYINKTNYTGTINQNLNNKTDFTHTINSSLVNNNGFRFNKNQSYNNPTTNNNYTIGNNHNTNLNQFMPNPNLNLNNNNNKNNKNFKFPNNSNIKLENMNETLITPISISGQSPFLTQNKSNNWPSQVDKNKPDFNKKRQVGKKAKNKVNQIQNNYINHSIINEADGEDIIIFQKDEYLNDNKIDPKNFNHSNLNNSLNKSVNNMEDSYIDCNFTSIKSISVDNIAQKIFNSTIECTQYNSPVQCEDVIFRENASTNHNLVRMFSFRNSPSKTHVMYFNDTLKNLVEGLEEEKIYSIYTKRLYQVMAGADGLVGIYIFWGFTYAKN